MKAVGRPLKFGDYRCGITSVAYDSEGKYLAVAAYDGSVKLFNAVSGNKHSTVKAAGSQDD